VNAQWTGERAVTALRLAAATTYSFTVVAVDPSRNASAPSAAVTATTQPTTDTTGPTAPGNLSAFDFGCETWLFWDESVDDVDPQFAILYEVYVNGVFDGAQTGIAAERRRAAAITASTGAQTPRGVSGCSVLRRTPDEETDNLARARREMQAPGARPSQVLRNGLTCTAYPRCGPQRLGARGLLSPRM
jgi:hypothetical protein